MLKVIHGMKFADDQKKSSILFSNIHTGNFVIELVPDVEPPFHAEILFKRDILELIKYLIDTVVSEE